MKNYTIKKYEPEDLEGWNNFISKAKNATFLFNRNFIDYHQKRYEDYSIIVLVNKKWVAVLPANRVKDKLYSHQGLTYGGLVFPEKTTMQKAMSIFEAMLVYLRDNKIETLQIKIIPSIYCNYFSDEMSYMLFLCKAKLWRRDFLSVIDLTKPYSLSKDRKQCVRRGIRNHLIIKEDLNFELFWNTILIPNLQKKHNVKPVHSLEEIILLHRLFPNNIRHFNVFHGDRIVAGTTVFITDSVAHPQYISGNDQKNELGSLDYLYNFLINDVFKDKNFFDFGTSGEENGLKINEGLLFWKESFGARTIVQDYYEVETANAGLLQNVFI